MWVQLSPEHVERARAALATIHPDIAERLHHYQELEKDPLTALFRAASVDDGDDGTLEFDDDAVVSISDDGGAYVMSWSWVSNADAGIGPEEEDADG